LPRRSPAKAGSPRRSIRAKAGAQQRRDQRFTVHASRGDQFVPKNRQIPARPANGKCLSISILRHESRGSCQVLWTQFPRFCQSQLTGAQHVINAETPPEFVRFCSDTLPLIPLIPRIPTNASTLCSALCRRCKPAGLCPDDRPDGGTNSPLFPFNPRPVPLFLLRRLFSFSSPEKAVCSRRQRKGRSEWRNSACRPGATCGGAPSLICGLLSLRS